MKKRSFYFKKNITPGASPGTINLQEEAQKNEITLRAYDNDSLVEYNSIKLEDIKDVLSANENKNFWLDITGFESEDFLNKIAKMFKIHRLAIEDIANSHQRPKIDEYQDHLFMVFQTPFLNEQNSLENQQISFFLNKNTLITFNINKTAFFEPIINRLKKDNSVMRSQKIDYLAYAVIDKIIDSAFPILQKYGDMLDELDEHIIKTKDRNIPLEIHNLKSEFLTLKRIISPTIEVINYLTEEDEVFFEDETKNYLNDCYDHSVKIVEMIEIYRETASSIMDLFLSVSASKMNDVIKILTMISTIFIPLSFIAGIYGMNFKNMPELDWEYGYFITLGFMLLMIILMLGYFWRKGWIFKD